MIYNIDKIRNDFPILKEKVYGKPIIYFDNGATTQKPKMVVDSMNNLYLSKNSSIHRGVHFLSEQMTEAYESARKEVSKFINAKHEHEIVFTSGATGSINGLAFSFGERYITENDEIVITEMEHHANIVPWQMLCDRKKAKLKILEVNERGELKTEDLIKIISKKTKMIALVHVSNTLGTINPVKEIVNLAHQYDIPVLIDGAQAVQHDQVDVQDIDADFYVFSGHKMFGPTGIGVLYGKEKWMDELPPFHGGGDMVDKVSFEKTTYNELPFKFEAGTTNYIGAIGLGKAINYLQNIGMANIHLYEKQLSDYANTKLNEIQKLKLIGTAQNKICTFSFLIDGVHPYDTGMVLDKLGIAVRTGTHCTQPIMQHFGIDGTVRASLAMYNTKKEIDLLRDGLLKVIEMFS